LHEEFLDNASVEFGKLFDIFWGVTDDEGTGYQSVLM
jgi:hypothetical protein